MANLFFFLVLCISIRSSDNILKHVVTGESDPEETTDTGQTSDAIMSIDSKVLDNTDITSDIIANIQTKITDTEMISTNSTISDTNVSNDTNISIESTGTSDTNLTSDPSSSSRVKRPQIHLRIITEFIENEQSVNTNEDLIPDDSENIRRINTSSCKDRCDLNIQIPCSCNKECVIHGNCCEDMKMMCPMTAAQAHASYPKLLNAKTMCHDSGIFMITACDTESVGKASRELLSARRNSFIKTHVATNEEPSDIPIALRKAVAEISSGSSSDLAQILVNSPITDVSSTLTFLNYNVYKQCGFLPFAQHEVWLPVLETKTLATNPSSFEDFNDEKNVWYVPSSTFPVDKFSYSPCVPEAVSQCGGEVDPNLISLCEQSSISYVISYDNNTRVDCSEPEAPQSQRYCVDNSTVAYAGYQNTFKNRYCSLCSFVPQSPSMDVVDWSPKGLKRHSFDFLVVFKFSDFGFTLDVQDTSPLARFNPWREINCNVTEGNGLTEQAHCRVHECTPSFTMSPRQKCQVKHIVQFAVILDNEVNVLDPILDRLVNIIHCYINSLGYDFKQVQAKGLVSYIQNKNAIVMISEAYFDEKRQFVVPNQYTPEMILYLKDLALISKMMHGYVKAILHCRITTSENITNTENKWNNVTFSYVGDIYTPIETQLHVRNHIIPKTLTKKKNHLAMLSCEDLFDIKEPWVDPEKRNEQVQFELPTNHVTTCVCSTIYSKVCSLDCWNTPAYPDDEENVMSILKDSCLSSGSSKQSSSFKYDFGKTLLSFCWLLMLKSL